jgi:hypothetical protein
MMKSKLDFFARWYLPIVLLLAVLPRLALAWFEHGVNHPDEIFQVLEPAHRWVYGYGIQAWEFQSGARSWLLPGLLALLWKGLALLGVSSPLTIVPLLRLPFVALAIFSAYLASRLARKLAGDVAGGLAALLTAFTPLALYLDFRTTTEAASCPVVILVLLAVVEKKLIRAGAWMALLVFLRPTNGIVGLGVIASLLFAGRFRDTCRLTLGAVPVLAAGGLLDWVTWGGPFHHLIEYFRFNWIESGADVFGVQTAWSYVSLLVSTAPLLAFFLLPAVVGLVRVARQAPEPVVVAGLYLFVLSALGHKEARFLLPILPVLATITAAGLVSLVGPWLVRHAPATHTRMAILAIATVAVVVLCTLRARELTFADVRDPRGEPQDHVLFGKRDSINHLLVEAGEQPDLCGMLILGLMPNEMFSGGMTYLHRDVLLTSPANRQLWLLMSQAANYAIADGSVTPPGWQRLDERRGVTLLRRSGECISLPESYRPKPARPTSPQAK